jgi:hypothetical protein
MYGQNKFNSNDFGESLEEGGDQNQQNQQNNQNFNQLGNGGEL